MAVLQSHDSVVAPSSTPQGLRVNWGSIWSGFLIAVGVFMLLTVLGLAIGISTVDIGQGANSEGLGMGAAIWSGLTLLVALLIGGMAATRSGMIYDRAAGMVQGVLVWVLFILTLIYMASSGIGMLSSSIFSALGTVTQSTAAAVKNLDVSSLTSGDASQITARLNDPSTAQVVAAATGMSQEEARKTLTGITQKVDAAKSDPTKAAAEARNGLQEVVSKAGARVEQAAVQAQPYASATLWSTLIAMLLSLAASVWGAMIGRKQAAHRLDESLLVGQRL